MKEDKEERNGGTACITWGHDECPSSAQLVYPATGRAGGTYYNHAGGGGDTQCQPLDPNFLYTRNHRTPGLHRGYMYGAEYKIDTDSSSPLHGNHNTDVPCAVCHVSNCTAVYMVPAKYTCPSGWTRLYYGYLMSDYKSHHHTQFNLHR